MDGGTVDLGEIRLVPVRATELRADFPPDLLKSGGADLRCTLPGAGGEVRGELLEDGTLDPVDGRDWPPVGAGAEIVVRVEDERVLPIRYLTPGPPPWRIPWPTASLRITVQGDEEGERLEGAVVLVDGALFEKAFRDGSTFEVRGVTAGRHSVVVAERGHFGKSFWLVIREGEVRTLDVELRPREE